MCMCVWVWVYVHCAHIRYLNSYSHSPIPKDMHLKDKFLNCKKRGSRGAYYYIKSKAYKMDEPNTNLQFLTDFHKILVNRFSKIR